MQLQLMNQSVFHIREPLFRESGRACGKQEPLDSIKHLPTKNNLLSNAPVTELSHYDGADGKKQRAQRASPQTPVLRMLNPLASSHTMTALLLTTAVSNNRVQSPDNVRNRPPDTHSVVYTLDAELR